MKKILSIVLALMLAVVSFTAVAEEATSDTLVNTALSEGRNVAIDATISGNEDLGLLNGASLHADAQFAGAPRLALTVKNAEAVLTDLMIGTDDTNVYLRLSNIGEDTYTISKATIMRTVLSLVEAADLSIADVFSSMIDMAEASDADTIAEAIPDLSNVDLTPMMSAVFTTMMKTTINDVDDYTMNEEAITSDTPAELTEEAAEATAEAAEEDLEALLGVDEENASIADPVAMTATVVLDADDLSVINNAIAATIEANADYAAVMGIDAEEIYEMIESFIDALTEPVTVVVNLDADGCPVYFCVSYAMGEDEENNVAFLIQGYKSVNAATTAYAFDIRVSTDETDNYVALFSANYSVTDQGDSTVYNAGIVLGDEVNGYGIEGQLISDGASEDLSIESVSYVDSVRTVDYAIDAVGSLEVNGADFNANGAISVFCDPANSDGPLLTLNLSCVTGDPIIEDYTAAIALDQMDPEAEEDLVEDFVESLGDSSEAYSDTTEDVAEAVTDAEDAQ